MDYREIAPPPGTSPLVKVAWTLTGRGAPHEPVTHVATPDGCMEIIRRIRGRSAWQGEQPACFVAGVIDQPATLELSGDSAFAGVRLWPWAWNALGKIRSPALLNGWADLAIAAPELDLPGTAEELMMLVIGEARRRLQPDPLYEALLASRSVAELSRRLGRSHRALQRWFEQEIGVPPRTYLRLLRFSEAVEDLPSSPGSLAGHAAEHGYADQAHMARDFRAFAGATAAKVKKVARGPFLGRDS